MSKIVLRRLNSSTLLVRCACGREYPKLVPGGRLFAVWGQRHEQPRNFLSGRYGDPVLHDGEWLSRCDVDDVGQNDTLQGHASIPWTSVRRRDYAWKRWSVRNASPEHWMSKPRHSNPLPIGAS